MRIGNGQVVLETNEEISAWWSALALTLDRLDRETERVRQGHCPQLAATLPELERDIGETLNYLDQVERFGFPPFVLTEEHFNLPERLEAQAAALADACVPFPPRNPAGLAWGAFFVGVTTLLAAGTIGGYLWSIK